MRVVHEADPQPPKEVEDAPPATAEELQAHRDALIEDDEAELAEFVDEEWVSRAQPRWRWQERMAAKRKDLDRAVRHAPPREVLRAAAREARIRRSTPPQLRGRNFGRRAPRRAFVARPTRRARAPGRSKPHEPEPAQGRLTDAAAARPRRAA
jgi:hypothetical protein